MTGTRRPLGFPPPSPNQENNDDGETDSEDEGENINEEETVVLNQALIQVLIEKSGHLKKEIESW